MSDTNVNSKVAKAWSEAVGRKIDFELREVEAADGRKQTQLINPETGSVCVAVNLTGSDAVDKLVENAGVSFLEAAFSQPEIDGPNVANHVEKHGSPVAPADGPGGAVEVKTTKTEQTDEQKEAEKAKKAEAAAKKKAEADAKKEK